MSKPRFLIIDDKPYLWADIVRLRREQLAAIRSTEQPPLFDLVEDYRPTTQRSAAGRYTEPLLFDAYDALRQYETKSEPGGTT